jgi:sulfur-oxidizing protein SoxY
MAETLPRRALVAAGLAAAMAPLPRGSGATPAEARDLLQRLAPGAAREGRVDLRIEAIADNGAQVPLVVAVESPMTEADHVRALHVVADGNPAPGVASFAFTPRAGRCEVSMRLRLARSQHVVAVAEMSDGSLWTASREVTVTVGGCSA